MGMLELVIIVGVLAVVGAVVIGAIAGVIMLTKRKQ
jgi:hypothetical protein